MNDYELLGLMDTHKAMKNQGVDVPDSFPEFLAGVTPIEEEQPVVDTEWSYLSSSSSPSNYYSSIY